MHQPVIPIYIPQHVINNILRSLTKENHYRRRHNIQYYPRQPLPHTLVPDPSLPRHTSSDIAISHIRVCGKAYATTVKAITTSKMRLAGRGAVIHWEHRRLRLQALMRKTRVWVLVSRLASCRTRDSILSEIFCPEECTIAPCNLA